MNRKERRSREAQARGAPPGSSDPELREMMQRATALHRDGRIGQAMAGYDAILAREPRHADALQFMGVARMQSGDSEEAIGLLQRAVAVHPENSQAHYNLGLALRAEGEEQKALAAFRRAIAVAPQNFEAHNAIAGILLSAPDQIDTAHVHIRHALKYNSKHAPSLNNLALILKARGQLEEAIGEARAAISLAPRHAAANSTLGSLLLESGATEEAEKILRDAVALAPRDSSAHTNLGAALNFIGARAEAEAEFERALELDPENTDSLNDLALIRANQGRQEEAAALLQRALILKPDDPALHVHLGSLYRRQEKWGESIANFRRALDIEPNDLDRAQAFAESLRSCIYLPENAQMQKDMERCLRIEDINHDPLSVPAARLLRNSQAVAPLVEAARSGDFSLTATELQKGEVLAPLSSEFACLLLQRSPISDMALEILFTAIRKNLLELAVAGRLPERLRERTFNFICTLARQCFLNEYVYRQSAEEAAQAAALEEQIDDRLRHPEERPPRAAIAVLACYRSLAGLAASGILEGHELASRDDAFGRLITQQIRHTAVERELTRELPELGESGDEISRQVRRQYEESPYPRWTNLARLKPMPLRALIGDMFPFADLADLRISAAPDLLVAGCGTGAHAIASALRYRNSRVLALDLSLTSLAYGRRKAREMGVEGIEWARGDILALADHEGRFDMIDCGGVLHHMHEPMAGWRILRDLLKPGGVMKIGLYSELARADFVRLGSELTAADGDSANHIREYRHRIFAMPDDAPLKRVLALHDFFTLSECRDLLFHVEEHRFTLPGIRRCLDELELDFLGFEMRERSVIDRYRARFPDDPGAHDLDNWHRFETDNPNIFIGMYQFWVKPRGAAMAA
ncbi:MAG: tetratricopeptide repeat protein [Alphaproteobacteria bacterium]|jgi:tetratricopeptide (TPR) repeat protein/SAM-dependent methyltransferase|nr:tetratricopeptide repeat protein [Alphaproteobacteria bacterium]MDP6588286.1 tetratricopeptide repeat protein [Alphaproteobacteria bacterium]MDP6819041.1 tetratricopeptide repeat protein [Alphaproteobacteria bacterium]|tara:strand:+ start:1904 stop:4513 length:2610 start_codon:yes stop_codon:yes gene_type:complete